jgi:hypothetical protein
MGIRSNGRYIVTLSWFPLVYIRTPFVESTSPSAQVLDCPHNCLLLLSDNSSSCWTWMHFSYNRKQKKKIKKEKQNKGDANKRCLAKNKKGKLLPGIELVPVFFLSCTCLIVRVGHLLRVSEKEPGEGGLASETRLQFYPRPMCSRHRFLVKLSICSIHLVTPLSTLSPKSLQQRLQSHFTPMPGRQRMCAWAWVKWRETI